MSDAAVIHRQLKIKSGSAKRLYKEHIMYQQEAENLQRKLDKYKEEKADDWSIGNTTRMLDESRKMITDSASRLGVVVQELREILVNAEKDPALAQDEEVLKAKEVVEEVSV